jgi:site-specific DNA recombinase
MNKTYGLNRVSTLNQKDNTSLENQTKKIKGYCKVYDLELFDIITETESGGKNLNDRSGLSKLKELIEKGECDTIVVSKVDRLGRSLLQGLLFLKYCEENNVRVICIENGIDSSRPDSKLITNILFSIAENEKETIKSRLSDGRKRTFEDGKKPYGNISYGYRKNNKGEIVIDNYDAKVVSFIFKKMNSYLKNNSLTKKKRTIRLLKLLTKNGYKFNGKDFKYWNINTILSNPIYCGWLKWKDQIVKSSYPVIVSKRLFNTVQIT